MYVEFVPESHTYYCEGEPVPSVTQILHNQGIAPQYSDVAPAVLEKAAARGTLIHEEIQRYVDCGEPGMTEEFGLFVDLCEKEELKFYGAEVIVCNGSVAGTLDLVGSHNGKRILADVKTTATEDKEYWRWQLGLYDYIGNIAADEFAVIHLRPKKAQLVMLTPPSGDEIAEMLEAEAMNVLYAPPEVITPDLIRRAAEAKRKAQAAKAELDAVTRELHDLFIASGTFAAASEEVPDVKISFTPPRASERLDTKKLKAEQPEIVKQYSVQSLSSGTVRISVKGVEECS